MVAGFAVGGCAYLAPPLVTVGSCQLVVLADGPTQVPLQPPYRVRQNKVFPRAGSQRVRFHVVETAPRAEADITYKGRGWQTVHITLTDPEGQVRDDEDVPGEDINGGHMGTSLDTSGMWRERLQDDTAGCTQEFSIEVLAPTG